MILSKLLILYRKLSLIKTKLTLVTLIFILWLCTIIIIILLLLGYYDFFTRPIKVIKCWEPLYMHITVS